MRRPWRCDRFDYTDGPAYGADLTTLVRLVDRGHLHPEIGRLADWVHTPRVLAELRRRQIRGNAVLTIPTPSAQESAA